MEKPSPEKIKEIFAKEIVYGSENCKLALHCKSCLDEHNNGPYKDVMSPHEAMSYEAWAYEFEYAGGFKAGIVVVFCKKCGRKVWDSRHLQPWL